LKENKNMDKKIYLTVLIISLVLFTSLGAVSATDGSYAIPFINMDLYPQDDGSMHVKETLHFSFSGIF